MTQIGEPTMTDADNEPRTFAYVDLVGAALRVKLGHELGRHRVAYYALCDLTERLHALRPVLQTLAAFSPDEDVDLAELLAERWPASEPVDLDLAIQAMRAQA